MSDTASSTQEKPDDLQTQSLKSFKSFEELAKPTEPIEIVPAKPQEEKSQKTFRNRYPYCLVLHAVLGSLYVGYVFGAFTPIYEFISSYAYGEELPPLVVNFMISLVPLGAAFGALSGGKIAATLGRRTAMMIVDCLSIIATVLTLLPSEYALLAGRLLQGFTLGANTSITPLYIKEVAPSEIAGRLGTFNLLFVGLGILLVPLIGLGMPIGDNVTPDNNYYLIVLGVAGIFPLLRLLLSVTLVRFDTPRYLVYKNKETQALAVLSKIYAPTRAQDELALLITEKDLVMKKGKITYRELFSVKYRRRLFVGVMMAFFQPFSGIIAIIFFSHQIFSQGVDDPNSHTPTIYIIIMDVIQVLSNILASVVVERFGRRLLALLGFSIVTVLLAAFGIVCLFVSDSPILKFFIWGYMIGYGLSVGPLPPVIIADVLPDVAVGIAILTVWISCFVIGLGFPPIAKSIGIAWGFIIFAAISFIGVLFIIFFVKETKGKNEAEIAALYAPKENKKYSGVPNQA